MEIITELGGAVVTYKVTSRDFEISESMSTLVEEQIDRLERFANRILHCDIVFSMPHCHRRRERVHHIHIHLKTRTGDIIVDRENEKNPAHCTFRIALADAFDAVNRRLVSEFSKKQKSRKWRRRLSVSRREIEEYGAPLPAEA